MTSPGSVGSVEVSIRKQSVVDETTRLLSPNTALKGKEKAYAHAEVDLEAQLNLDGAGHSHEDTMIIRAYRQQEDQRQELEVLRQRQEELEARQRRFDTG